MLSLLLLFCSLQSTGLIESPVPEVHQKPRVEGVMPGSGTVHENLLRFSIRFDSPIGGDVLRKLMLLRSDGTQIDEPFLNQELWSPDGKTLTVIFGPGRVKTGLIAHDTLGRPLHAGDSVTLDLDGGAIAHWLVDRELIQPLDVRTWAISHPRKSSHDVLRVAFPEPVDGMDGDLLVVLRNGQPVGGKARLSADQKMWSFDPAEAWIAGQYQIAVHPHLEDPYGNEINSSFETPQAQSQHSQTEPAMLPLRLR